MNKTYLKPGSVEAIAAGCLCPILDNNHGYGNNGLYWINLNCPLHNDTSTKDVKEWHGVIGGG